MSKLIRASEEGTYEAVAIKDRWCGYSRLKDGGRKGSGRGIGIAGSGTRGMIMSGSGASGGGSGGGGVGGRVESRDDQKQKLIR